MKISIIFILLFCLISIKIDAQDLKSENIDHKDSLISVIPKRTHNEPNYSYLQSSGLIHKKVLGLFKKRAGSFSSTVVHYDTLIYSVSNVYQYKKRNQVIVETFYFDENSLIKYYKRKLVNSDGRKVLQHEITAYYDDFEVIEKSEIINDNYKFNASELLKVKSVADIEVHRHIEFMKARNLKN